MRTLLCIALTLSVACGGDDETLVPDAGPDAGVLDGGGFGVDGGPRDGGSPDGGPTPAAPTPTGVSVTSGGGAASSTTHRAILSVGAPVPRGEASSAEHRVVFGPAFIAR